MAPLSILSTALFADSPDLMVRPSHTRLTRAAVEAEAALPGQQLAPAVGRLLLARGLLACTPVAAAAEVLGVEDPHGDEVQ